MVQSIYSIVFFYVRFKTSGILWAMQLSELKGLNLLKYHRWIRRFFFEMIFTWSNCLNRVRCPQYMLLCLTMNSVCAFSFYNKNTHRENKSIAAFGRATTDYGKNILLIYYWWFFVISILYRNSIEWSMWHFYQFMLGCPNYGYHTQHLPVRLGGLRNNSVAHLRAPIYNNRCSTKTWVLMTIYARPRSRLAKWWRFIYLERQSIVWPIAEHCYVHNYGVNAPVHMYGVKNDRHTDNIVWRALR